MGIDTQLNDFEFKYLGVRQRNTLAVFDVESIDQWMCIGGVVKTLLSGYGT